MKKEIVFPSYNLSKHRPQILLVGNGITKQNGITTEELIRKTCKEGFNYNDFIKSSYSDNKLSIPFPILSNVSSDIDDKTRRDKYIKALKDIDTSNELVKKLSKMNFDAILTTNYTYEFEDCFENKYSSYEDKKKLKYSLSASQEKTYQLMYTCNHFNNSPYIWHIHGEQRRKTSLILNHNEYGKLINNIIQHNKDMGNKYEILFNDFKIKSWVDYFIIADIYILGLGLSFEEFDLWWLLFRRIRERNPKTTGKIIFYELWEEQNEGKYKILKNSKVTVENLGTEKTSDKNNETYNKFYKKAISDIESKLEETNLSKSATCNTTDSTTIQEHSEAS